MDDSEMYDYIVVGQGIAGTVLSSILIKNGKKVLVVDREEPSSSSKVAAGIFNPVTGKRMVRTWQHQAIFPFLHDFYEKLEKDLGEKMLFKKNIYTPFSSVEEQNYWISQSHPGGDIDTSIPSARYEPLVFNNAGGFEVKGAGYVDVPKMLHSYKQYLIRKGAYLASSFQFHEMDVKEDMVLWKDKKAKRIIFCEGYRATENPFFKWLPFVLTKGEVLTVKIPGFSEEVIFNKGVFVLPLGNFHFKVGATYQWEFRDHEISEAAREDLCLKLGRLVKLPYEVINHEAGIRPTVKDRRPLIGIHPQYRPLGIFNGLGTKGISLAPYFAYQFFEHLEKGKNLNPEVNIKRFYTL